MDTFVYWMPGIPPSKGMFYSIVFTLQNLGPNWRSKGRGSPRTMGHYSLHSVGEKKRSLALSLFIMVEKPDIKITEPEKQENLLLSQLQNSASHPINHAESTDEIGTKSRIAGGVHLQRNPCGRCRYARWRTPEEGGPRLTLDFNGSRTARWSRINPPEIRSGRQSEPFQLEQTTENSHRRTAMSHDLIYRSCNHSLQPWNRQNGEGLTYNH